MNRTILTTGILLGLLGIVLGAFGAHGLEKLVDSEAVDSFETGVRYQMYHALLLVILGIWDGLAHKKRIMVFRFICIGTFFFSFSIYFLSINTLFTFNVKPFGFLTPIGGLVLIAGWALLAFYVWTNKINK